MMNGNEQTVFVSKKKELECISVLDLVKASLTNDVNNNGSINTFLNISSGTALPCIIRLYRHRHLTIRRHINQRISKCY
jgi:hypothetical protein